MFVSKEKHISLKSLSLSICLVFLRFFYAESEPAANTAAEQSKMCQRDTVSSDEEARLREVSNSLSKENQELKQRKRF